MMARIMVRRLMVLLYIAVSFHFFLIQNVFTWGIDIDTRVGHAQQFQSYVYDEVVQIPEGTTTAMYGDVEFRKGLRLHAMAATVGLDLGVTPPINGIIEDEHKSPYSNVLTIKSNLELGAITFTGNGFVLGPDAPYFSFEIQGPYTIALTQDLILSGTYTIDIHGSEGSLLDGRGNTVYLAPGGRIHELMAYQYGPMFLANPDQLTVKNMKIDGITEYNFGVYVPETLSIFDNVQFRVGVGQLTGQAFSLRNCIFSGSNNMLFGGGTFNFAKTGVTGVGDLYDRIRSNSKLYVGPNTTLILGSQLCASYNFLFEDETAELFLDNCTLAMQWNEPSDTMIFTKGTMTINGVVTLQIVPSYLPSTKLQIGDGVDAANNFHINILPGSKLVIDNGATLINKNV